MFTINKNCVSRKKNEKIAQPSVLIKMFWKYINGFKIRCTWHTDNDFSIKVIYAYIIHKYIS